MNFLLYGDWRLNAGPNNVNKSLIQHSDKNLLYFKAVNKYLLTLEAIIKVIMADVVVFSCGGSLKMYRFAKMLGKKIAILKHGDSSYENEINHLGVSDKQLLEDQKLMDIADALICVSEKYSEWVARRYPQYKEKITWVNNGVTISPRPKVTKDKHVIALGGGNRDIKNNFNVCRAIKKMNDNGANLKVKLFGRIYDGNASLTDFPFVKSMGQMDKNEYYNELDKVALYIDAAYCEPFGLSVADAVNCNCSLLLSDNVGFLSIIDYEDCDIVHDCDDINEIASKIDFLLDHPNSQRILESIHPETCSEQYAYQRLKRICGTLYKGCILR